MQAAPVAAAASSPAGPTTQLLDDFNRANEAPLSQSGAWAPYDPRGGCCFATLRVLSQQASASDGQNRISFRSQDYPGDFELYATIAAKPGNGNAVGLVLNIVEIGPYSWDGYYLTWDDQAGTDTLRFEKVTDNQFGGNIATTNLEMSAGDRFLARRIGDQLEGWVYQSGSWSLRLQATDTSYHGGKIGALIRNTTGRLDDFGGGGYVPPPPPVTSDPPLLDNFNRANENPVSQGGNWASIGINGGKGARLSGNRLTTFGQPGTSYRVSLYPNDMDASATITTAPSSNDWLSIYVSLQDVGTTGWDGYELRATTVSGPDLWQIRKVLNGAPTILAATNFEITVGSMLLRRLGTGLEFWWKPSGGSWGRQLATADTTYGTGKIGVGGQKSGALDDFGGGDATNVALLQTYAPELRFTSDETYRADSAAIATDLWFADPYRTTLLKHASGAAYAAADPASQLDDLSLAYLGSQAFPFDYLSEPADDIGPAATDYTLWIAAHPEYRQQAYGRIVVNPSSGEKILQYWLYYYYNPKNVVQVGKHEGDWEWLQVHLSATNEPISVALEQHDSPERCDWGPSVELSQSGRLVVYVAYESHANYFWAGTHPRNNLPDDVTRDDGPQYREVPSILDVSTNTPGWILWNGQWGDSFGIVSSPLSPGVRLSWSDPWTWEGGVLCTPHPSFVAPARSSQPMSIQTPADRGTPPLPRILSARIVDAKNGRAVRVRYCFPAMPTDPWRLPSRLHLALDNLHDNLPPLSVGWTVKLRCGTITHPAGPIKPPYLLRYWTESLRGTWSKRVEIRLS